MMKRLCSWNSTSRSVSAFTLVELLVALGLVALMMMLFAEVFTIATGTMSTQRGIMENDQRARSITTVLRGDLARRTFRTVVPWAPGEHNDSLTTANVFQSRRGYISISENDYNNQADDILQLTVDGSQFSSITGLPPVDYYGRAAYLDPNDPSRPTLLQRGRSITSANAGAPLTGYFEVDDTPPPTSGVNQQPFAATVQVGDVVMVSGSTANDGYYVVLSLTTSGTTTRLMVTPDVPDSTGDGRMFRQTNQEPDTDDGQIGNATARSPYAEICYFLRNGTLYRRVLLIRNSVSPQPLDDGNQSFFDYTDANYGWFVESAANNSGDFLRGFDFSAYNNSSSPGAQFHGVNSLSCNTALGGFTSLGMPRYRFGHQTFKTNPGTPPPTYVLAEGRPREFVGTTNNIFIGRFTQQETSHSGFNYPQGFSTGSINPMDPTVTLTLNSNGAVQPFHDEIDGSRRGEDILLTNVHSFDVKIWDNTIGDFVDVGHNSASGQFYFDYNNVASNVDASLQPSYGPQPTNFNANRMFDTWHPQYDLDLDGNYDVSPYLPLLRDPQFTPGVAVWQANQPYAVDQIVLPTEYRHTTPTDLPSPTNPIPRHLAFRCVVAGTSDATTEPIWPLTSQTGTAIVDNTVVWQAIYNLQPVKALKITIRYLDVTSDQMRQVTLIQSLID